MSCQLKKGACLIKVAFYGSWDFIFGILTADGKTNYCALSSGLLSFGRGGGVG